VDKKLALALTLGALLGFVGLSSAPEVALASTPCVHTKFDTKLVGDACKAGGQEEAKTVMKAWVKAAKEKDANLKLTCNSCHSSLAPNFELKSDALTQFKNLGGK
jgi:hypothetical protein